MANNKLFDRVKMSVSGTPGTGTITLSAAATGYRSFSGAGVANSNVVSYLIEDGSSWEFGTGTYTSSGTTLSRDTVTASSAGGTTKISATSGVFVYITALAADLVQVDSAGNVNIGTTNVAAKLYVSGNAASNIGTLTDGATIAVDMSTANNFSVTLGGNRTLGNPTNLTAGQSGVIFITQDSTGSRTLNYGTSWDFPNQTAPTLTTTASAVDVLVYTVRTTTSIAAQLLTNIGPL